MDCCWSECNSDIGHRGEAKPKGCAEMTSKMYLKDAGTEADKSNGTERVCLDSNPFSVYLLARTPPQNRCSPEETKVILLLGPSNDNSNTLQSNSCVNGVNTQLLCSEVQLHQVSH